MTRLTSAAGAGRREAAIWLLIAAVVLVFVAVYVALFGLIGVWTSLLFVVPLAAFAVKCGLRGGLISGLLSLPFNWTLALVVGRQTPQTKPEHLLMWAVGIIAAASIGAIRDSNVRYRGLNAELAQANTSLTEALAQVRTLSGLVPICAGCGKLRNDQGYWLRVDEYMRGHPAVEFSHGFCPECLKRLYPEATEEKGATR